jgi:hypothetical protein
MNYTRKVKKKMMPSNQKILRSVKMLDNCSNCKSNLPKIKKKKLICGMKMTVFWDIVPQGNDDEGDSKHL